MKPWVKQTLLTSALILSICFCAPTWAENAVMVIAQRGFRDEELFRPKEILEKAGVVVTIASLTLQECKGMLGSVVKPDTTIDQVKVDDYDIIVFVGGSGASQYFDNLVAHRLAQEAVNKKKILGAICIAPVILANAGVLDGRRATVWSSESGQLEAKGAYFTGAPVQVDGKIVTANGPSAAEDFARAMVGYLKK